MPDATNDTPNAARAAAGERRYRLYSHRASDTKSPLWVVEESDGLGVWYHVAAVDSSADARLVAFGVAAVAALAGLEYPADPGQILPRFCDHAAEPCDRCAAARAALAGVRPEGRGQQ